MIKLEKINKYYGNNHVLKNISLEINKGEIVSIIGKSGAGKSTILRCINMLTEPDNGYIYINGINAKDCNITKMRQKIGMVFQSYNLFEHLTVKENLIIGPTKLLRKNKNFAEEKAQELLNIVGLEDKISAFPSELSGGQKQRIAIARVLTMEPEIILFDEPTSSLDPIMKNEVLEIIYKLTSNDITMIIVTHEMRFAKTVSDRVIYIEDGELIEDGTSKQIFDNSQDERTRRFIEFEFGVE
jgi:polar amino acid transport system ATP-binding protein